MAGIAYETDGKRYPIIDTTREDVAGQLANAMEAAGGPGMQIVCVEDDEGVCSYRLVFTGNPGKQVLRDAAVFAVGWKAGRGLD